MSIPKDFEKTIDFVAEKIKGKKYAIRGTSSLVLQRVSMNVDDIDIVCDKATALSCNEIFKDYLVEKVEYRQSPKFRSYFGKFKINNIQVEVMGEWQIKNQKGKWSRVYDGSDRIKINNVWLTTISSELEMFSEMGRWSAYWKIKKSLSA